MNTTKNSNIQRFFIEKGKTKTCELNVTNTIYYKLFDDNSNITSYVIPANR